MHSDPDVSLTIAYKFNSTTEPVTKKRKSSDSRRSQTVLDYSAIKLPAHSFIDYLEKYLNNFITECLR